MIIFEFVNVIVWEFYRGVFYCLKSMGIVRCFVFVWIVGLCVLIFGCYE